MDQPISLRNVINESEKPDNRIDFARLEPTFSTQQCQCENNEAFHRGYLYLGIGLSASFRFECTVPKNQSKWAENTLVIENCPSQV